MMNAQVSLPIQELADLCRRYHIRKLSIFGSALRDDFRPDSDIDLLIEFEPGHSVGYIGLGFIEDEFSKLLDGREIDLVTLKALNHRIRDRVLAEAKVLYEG